MLAECPEKLNFTQFPTLFDKKLHGTDSETALRDAFVMFDEEKKGKLAEEYVKHLLMNVGDQFSKDYFNDDVNKTTGHKAKAKARELKAKVKDFQHSARPGQGCQY